MKPQSFGKLHKKYFLTKNIICGLAAVLFLAGTAHASVRVVSLTSSEGRKLLTFDTTSDIAAAWQNANFTALVSAPPTRAGSSVVSLMDRVANATNIDYLATSLIAVTCGLLAMACRPARRSASKWCPDVGLRTYRSKAGGGSSPLD